MIYKVIIDINAEQDLVEIFSYITETLKAPAAAKRLYTKIKQEIIGLKDMPQRCPLIDEEPYSLIGVRKKFVGNYIIFFIVNEATGEVRVFRILYNRREWHSIL